MDEFKQDIKQWVNIDNKIKDLNTQLKVLREHKKHKLDNLVKYHNNNNLNGKTITISDGRLEFCQHKQLYPITQRNLEDGLKELFDDEETINTIINTINSKRKIKLEQNIKRYYNI